MSRDPDEVLEFYNVASIVQSVPRSIGLAHGTLLVLLACVVQLELAKVEVEETDHNPASESDGSCILICSRFDHLVLSF